MAPRKTASFWTRHRTKLFIGVLILIIVGLTVAVGILGADKAKSNRHALKLLNLNRELEPFDLQESAPVERQTQARDTGDIRLAAVANNTVVWADNVAVYWTQYDTRASQWTQHNHVLLDEGRVDRIALNASGSTVVVSKNQMVWLFTEESNKWALIHRFDMERNYLIQDIQFTNDDEWYVLSLRDVATSNVGMCRVHVNEASVESMEFVWYDGETRDFGARLAVQHPDLMVSSDPEFNGNRGRVMCWVRGHNAPNTLSSDDDSVLSFGQNVYVDTKTRGKVFLFVGCGTTEQRLFQYEIRDIDKSAGTCSFHKVAELRMPSVLTGTTVTIPRFGWSMTSSDQFFIVSAPCEPEDQFGIVFVYSWTDGRKRLSQSVQSMSANRSHYGHAIDIKDSDRLTIVSIGKDANIFTFLHK